MAVPAAHAPGERGPGPQRPAEYDTVLALLRLARVVSIVLSVVGFVVTVSAIAGPGFFGRLYLIGFPVIMAVANVFVFLETGPIESFVLRGLYSPAKEKLFLWTLIGLVAAGVIPGILLLLALMKLDPVINWQRTHAPFPEVDAPTAAAGATPGEWRETIPAGAPLLPTGSSWSPSRTTSAQPAPTAWVPPATAPATEVPPTATPPPTGGSVCPRCGKSATWIAQYNRWYCYSCAQYV